MIMDCLFVKPEKHEEKHTRYQDNCKRFLKKKVTHDIDLLNDLIELEKSSAPGTLTVAQEIQLLLLEPHKDLLLRLQKKAATIPDLQYLCRSIIRSQLPYPINTSICGLPRLPTSIKAFLRGESELSDTENRE